MADDGVSRAHRACEELPRTMAEAKAAGSKWFFTGKPCCYGHLSIRPTNGGTCSECHRITARAQYACDTERIKARILARERALRIEDPEKARQLSRKKMRAWRSANPELARAAARAWQSENKDRVRELRRARYALDPARHRAKTQKWRAANPEKAREGFLSWYLANPELNRNNERKRRARKANAEGTHTAADIARIRKMQRDRCAYCATKLKGEGHVDHIIALTKGGSNWPKNLQLLCAPCNCSKHNSDPIEFMQAAGRLL